MPDIAHEALQDHIGTLLLLLGLGDHARPESPAAVMEQEILPAVRAWRVEWEALKEALECGPEDDPVKKAGELRGEDPRPRPGDERWSRNSIVQHEPRLGQRCRWCGETWAKHAGVTEDGTLVRCPPHWEHWRQIGGWSPGRAPEEEEDPDVWIVRYRSSPEGPWRHPRLAFFSQQEAEEAAAIFSRDEHTAEAIRLVEMEARRYWARRVMRSRCWLIRNRDAEILSTYERLKLAYEKAILSGSPSEVEQAAHSLDTFIHELLPTTEVL